MTLTTYLVFCADCEYWHTANRQKGAAILAARHHHDTGHEKLYVGRTVEGASYMQGYYAAEIEALETSDREREAQARAGLRA
jgi:hypothetical protein